MKSGRTAVKYERKLKLYIIKVNREFVVAL